MTVLVDLVAAARPNFMKVAPLYHALVPLYSVILEATLYGVIQRSEATKNLIRCTSAVV